MHVQEIINTHPQVRGQTNDALIRCIEECYSCAQTCTSCADACFAEDNVKSLTQCIRLNLDCADVSSITGRIATRRTGSDEEMIRRMLHACAVQYAGSEPRNAKNTPGCMNIVGFAPIHAANGQKTTPSRRMCRSRGELTPRSTLSMPAACRSLSRSLKARRMMGAARTYS